MNNMKVMQLEKICRLDEEREPLRPADISIPTPGPGEILVKVSRCGVCHTELDEIEGRTPPLRFPVVPGHQVVGKDVDSGDRVGIAWIHHTCGVCEFCLSGKENLCSEFSATGRDVNGGYGEYMTVPRTFAYLIPDAFSDSEAAPLLCAGAIGYRSMVLTGMGNSGNLGLTGFGASAHLVLKMVKYKYPAINVFVFARSAGERAFAMELGAAWTGDTTDSPPEKLHAVIDTTPVWKPVVEGLKHLHAGGRLVINAIRKESTDKKYLLHLEYPRHLWMEKEIKSVANVTRQDVREFLELAADIPIKPEVVEYPLEDANIALMEIKEKKIRGAKVLKI